MLAVRAGSPRGYSDGLFGWFEDRALVTFADGESAPMRVHRSRPAPEQQMALGAAAHLRGATER